MMPTRYKTWSLDIVTRYNICTLWLVTFWQLERSGKFSEFLIFLLLLGWSYLVTLIQPGNILALNRRSTNWARDCELVLTCASIKYLSWKYLLKWGVAAAKNYRFSTTPCLKLLQIFGNKMRATHGLCYDSVKSIKRAVLYVMNICTLCLSQSSISARSRNTEMSSVQAHTALLAWRVPNRSDGLYSIIMCHPKIGALQASCDPDQDSVVVDIYPSSAIPSRLFSSSSSSSSDIFLSILVLSSLMHRILSSRPSSLKFTLGFMNSAMHLFSTDLGTTMVRIRRFLQCMDK